MKITCVIALAAAVVASITGPADASWGLTMQEKSNHVQFGRRLGAGSLRGSEEQQNSPTQTGASQTQESSSSGKSKEVGEKKDDDKQKDGSDDDDKQKDGGDDDDKKKDGDDDDDKKKDGDDDKQKDSGDDDMTTIKKTERRRRVKMMATLTKMKSRTTGTLKKMKRKTMMESRGEMAIRAMTRATTRTVTRATTKATTRATIRVTIRDVKSRKATRARRARRSKEKVAKRRRVAKTRAVTRSRAVEGKISLSNRRNCVLVEALRSSWGTNCSDCLTTTSKCKGTFVLLSSCSSSVVHLAT
ncbi:uncharacterized protein PITG_22808 [Phytophthora infestans T30-4]|uniref:Uncharacterized protein n=1 Tax=Phytophthora infestans (strain T30-4) TaxID=403677 RepID=D0N857_PHYIT|nr:uncharacterized protein PITG_22808 [Phytophthora infestans T30-4]EEY53174.1 conserved hypothetical protein [Phytophthora infestans T30-4]|eukprot:XP_002904792.1 conserved hypothetical protein [Phytophthora infestans T30-4]